MGTPFLSEIRLVSFNFAPKGWAFCNGQILAINQNQALFALLGTTYGGNGTTTFALPNLQGRIAMHMGNSYTLGQAGGAPSETLTVVEMPVHTHQASAVTTTANVSSPSGEAWAASASNPYGTSPSTTMAAATVATVGGGQPHDNIAPYLALNFVIALQGIFPSQN